ncbi:MAG: gliding motility-associated C-terminal domain-containing protein, partial [Owenweeksia sp.]
GILRPVIDINRNCNFFPGQTATSVINLILEKPFDVNGRYIMFTKTGNDGDVIANECGFELAPYFIFLIDVSDCPPLIYSVENVTVQEDKQIKVDWTVNPEYFAKGADKVFSAWAILKRPANAGAFYPQDYIKAPTARSWVDNFVTKEEVDATQFEYSIQLIQNGVALAPQNNVNSILLKSETVNENELAFTWNEYYGWGNPQYQFYWGAYDSTLSDFDWQPLGPLDNSKSLTFLIDDNIGATEELLYGFKVEAESPDPSVTFISESNWLTLDYRPKVPDPEDTILGTPYIPNVFTPNNDGFHDTFWISLEEKDGNFRQYPEVSVEVYNRWGLLVYQNSNFGEINTQAEGWDGTDMNSGQQLADGVYYYVINMKDPETFTEKNFKGHLTIFKNGQ